MQDYVVYAYLFLAQIFEVTRYLRPAASSEVLGFIEMVFDTNENQYLRVFRVENMTVER